MASYVTKSEFSAFADEIRAMLLERVATGKPLVAAQPVAQVQTPKGPAKVKAITDVVFPWGEEPLNEVDDWARSVFKAVTARNLEQGKVNAEGMPYMSLAAFDKLPKLQVTLMERFSAKFPELVQDKDSEGKATELKRHCPWIRQVWQRSSTGTRGFWKWFVYQGPAARNGAVTVEEGETDY